MSSELSSPACKLQAQAGFGGKADYTKIQLNYGALDVAYLVDLIGDSQFERVLRRAQLGFRLLFPDFYP